MPFAIAAVLLPVASLAQTTGTGTGTGAAATGAAEKLICRREVPIGSLIARKKTCKTRAEWQQLADAARASAEYQQQQGQSRPEGQ